MNNSSIRSRIIKIALIILVPIALIIIGTSLFSRNAIRVANENLQEYSYGPVFVRYPKEYESKIIYGDEANSTSFSFTPKEGDNYFTVEYFGKAEIAPKPGDISQLITQDANGEIKGVTTSTYKQNGKDALHARDIINTNNTEKIRDRHYLYWGDNIWLLTFYSSEGDELSAARAAILDSFKDSGAED